MKTKCLASLFQNRVYVNKNAPFLGTKVGYTWQWMDWEECSAWVEKAGRALLALGVKTGENVAILSENRFEWALSDLAIQSIGAVSVPIYSTNSTDQTNYILEHSGVRIIFLSSLPSNPIFQKDIFASLLSMESIQKIVSFDLMTENSASSKWIFLDQFLNLGTPIIPQLFYDRVENIRGEDVSTIIYTSGTTGNPKGVMLTHNNILSNCEMAANELPVDRSDTTLSFLPLSHAFERTGGLYGMIYKSVRIAYAQNMGTIGQNILEISPTILFCVPRVLEKIHASIWDEVKKKPKFVQRMFNYALELSTVAPEKMDFSQRAMMKFFYKIFFLKVINKLGGKIRFIISGGAKLNPKIAEFFQRIGIPILQGYGLTETSPVISLNLPHKNRIGSVGLPLAEGVVRISEDGEILARGPMIMKGYFKDPDATKAAIDAEGYFHTGDVGHLDDEGYLFITDRIKELIITSGGKKIPPQTLENQLQESELIEQACVIGEGQKFVAALIVPQFDRLNAWARQHQIDETDPHRLIELPQVLEVFRKIVGEVNASLASYESIKTFQLLDQDFNIQNGLLTPTLKLKRKNILNHYSKIIDKIYLDTHEEKDRP